MSDEKKRIDKPLDTLRKRQILYSCEALHEFLKLPGKFKKPSVNEIPTPDNKQTRTDGTYYGELDGKETIFNPEDESMKVGEKELLKSYKYNRNLRRAFNEMDVYSSITTPLPLSKCTRCLTVDNNFNYTPDIRSYTSHYNGAKILSNMTNQITKYKHSISDADALNIIMLPLMFEKNQDKILEKTCVLLKQAKLENPEFKKELTMQKQCVIHKYAKTFEDIERLEEVITLKVTETETKNPNNWQIQALINSGINEGEINMALRFKDELGMKEAVRISGISREILEIYDIDE